MYLAVPAYDQQTPPAVYLRIIYQLCTPFGATAPANRQSAETRAAGRRSRRYADRIICTWNTLFAEAKSKLFFCCMFFWLLLR